MRPGRLFQSEAQFVQWLRRRARSRSRGLRLGIGDDAGLIDPRPDRQLLVTADMAVEGVHFSRRLHPPDSVGHRSLARSLSDIAAMGGTPKFVVIALALSRRVDRPWIESFYYGVFRLARRFGVTILGGDTAVYPGGVLADVTVIGECVRGRALLRSGARPGDAIYVGGKLGLSALGLRLLRSRKSLRNAGARQAVRAHLYPEPLCALGRFLAERRLASSAMDISDGLSTDLGRLCEASDVGARIWADHIPGPRACAAQEMRPALPLSMALHGGEDYSLLFTVPRGRIHRLPSVFEGIHLYKIGEVCASRQRHLVFQGGKERPLMAGGYDHFRGKAPTRGQ